MTVVLDASCALELITKGSKASLIKTYLLHSDNVLSSDLYKAECANALWKYVRAGALGHDDAVTLLEACNKLVFSFVDIAENSVEALLEAEKLKHPVYDMLYFTLARREGATLLTMDKKLTELCGQNRIDCPIRGTI